MGDYVNGMWKDSTGNENPVSFKGKWGSTSLRKRRYGRS